MSCFLMLTSFSALTVLLTLFLSAHAFTKVVVRGKAHGAETDVFLKYIVDHYENFPDVALFVEAIGYENQVDLQRTLECISPEATWYKLSVEGSPPSARMNRSQDFFRENSVELERYTRKVFQILWELDGQNQEFRRRLPLTTPFIVNATSGNQFLVSRAMIHKRPLNVWKGLLNFFGLQSEVKVQSKRKNANILAYTSEHLNHVIFGHKEIEWKVPTQEEICQNFIPNCPGSPCEASLAFDKTSVVKVQVDASNVRFFVLHKGKRYDFLTNDTLVKSIVPNKNIHAMDLETLNHYSEGPVLPPCGVASADEECLESVYFKVLQSLSDE